MRILLDLITDKTYEVQMILQKLNPTSVMTSAKLSEVDILITDKYLTSDTDTTITKAKLMGVPVIYVKHINPFKVCDAVLITYKNRKVRLFFKDEIDSIPGFELDLVLRVRLLNELKGEFVLDNVFVLDKERVRLEQVERGGHIPSYMYSTNLYEGKYKVQDESRFTVYTSHTVDISVIL